MSQDTLGPGQWCRHRIRSDTRCIWFQSLKSLSLLSHSSRDTSLSGDLWSVESKEGFLTERSDLSLYDSHRLGKWHLVVSFHDDADFLRLFHSPRSSFHAFPFRDHLSFSFLHTYTFSCECVPHSLISSSIPYWWVWKTVSFSLSSPPSPHGTSDAWKHTHIDSLVKRWGRIRHDCYPSSLLPVDLSFSAKQQSTVFPFHPFYDSRDFTVWESYKGSKHRWSHSPSPKEIRKGSPCVHVIFSFSFSPDFLTQEFPPTLPSFLFWFPPPHDYITYNVCRETLTASEVHLLVYFFVFLFFVQQFCLEYVMWAEFPNVLEPELVFHLSIHSQFSVSREFLKQKSAHVCLIQTYFCEYMSFHISLFLSGGKNELQSEEITCNILHSKDRIRC